MHPVCRRNTATTRFVFLSGLALLTSCVGVASEEDDTGKRDGGSAAGRGGAAQAGHAGSGGEAGGSSGGAGSGGSGGNGGAAPSDAGTGAAGKDGGVANDGSGKDTANAGSDVATAAPGIQYFGRWDMSDPNSPSGSWGPIGLKAKFEGTSVSIKLNDVANSFGYSIDGGPMKVLGPGAAAQSLLASGLPSGVHMLEFFRRSEGGYGKTVVGGLVLDPGKKVLSPDPRPPHKIEVVGNSISAGFGNEGMGGNTPQTQNGYMAYGPQLARMLNAEWSVVAHSGQGMYRNLCEALPPAQQHMPDEFALLNHPAVPGPPWDFGKWKPDVLIIELGTNDYADYPPGSCAAPSDDAFKAAYAKFLTSARAAYPDAEIFALGTFIATAANMFSKCNATICAAVAQKNDARMHCIDPSLGADGYWLVGPGDYIGDWTHPTIAGHTKVAARLRDIIKPVMGW